MAGGIEHEETIFHAARAASDEEQSAYLAQACGDDNALRDRIKELLKIYEMEPSSDGVRRRRGRAVRTVRAVRRGAARVR